MVVLVSIHPDLFDVIVQLASKDHDVKKMSTSVGQIPAKMKELVLMKEEASDASVWQVIDFKPKNLPLIIRTPRFEN
jgi:hypothetical protein